MQAILRGLAAAKQRLLERPYRFARILDGGSTSRRTLARRALRLVSGSALLRLDSRPVPAAAGEIRLFMVARNESLRLPYCFRYYRRLGVDRFFLIDNDSTDGGREYALAQPDTHVFWSGDSYKQASCGHLWLETLLGAYGRDGWCVVVDADEVLVYPHCESATLRDLCRFLDGQRQTAMFSILVEMYSRAPFAKNLYRPNQDPLEVCAYLDADNYAHSRVRALGQTRLHVTGGMRQRVFGTDACLNKYALLKWTGGLKAYQGMHWIDHAAVADVSGAVLHFKYFSDFADRVREEVARKQHWSDAAEYREYLGALARVPDLCPHYDGSVRFTDSSQLTALGIAHSSPAFDEFCGLLHPSR
jgi:hypothetical protein